MTFVVLDRPNPLGGEMVAGPAADLPDTILSVALLEGSNASEGRGTGAAFTKLGAPWARVDALLAAVAGVPGVEAARSTFTPRPTPTGPDPKFNGKRCRGIALEVTGDGVHTFALGLRLLRALRSQPGFAWLPGGASIDALVGTRRLRRALDRGASVDAILTSQRAGVAAWRRARAPALLYE